MGEGSIGKTFKSHPRSIEPRSAVFVANESLTISRSLGGTTSLNVRRSVRCRYEWYQWCATAESEAEQPDCDTMRISQWDVVSFEYISSKVDGLRGTY